jgi:hypothetical protein
MSLRLEIKCSSCGDGFTEDWDKILNYRGIRPGMEWGIDKVRFYALPNIRCVKCHWLCSDQIFAV